MFGLFGKKKKGLIVHDKIWATDKAKFTTCLASGKSDPKVLFVAWFEETRNNLQAYFRENNFDSEVYLADRLGLMQQDRNFIFVEHHPLQTEEQRVAAHFGKEEITVFSSLAEPIFQLFGSDRIVDMMKKMGMKEDEMIEHQMISNSIIRAQEKIASESSLNISAKSQGEWLVNAGVSKL